MIVEDRERKRSRGAGERGEGREGEERKGGKWGGGRRRKVAGEGRGAAGLAHTLWRKPCSQAFPLPSTEKPVEKLRKDASEPKDLRNNRRPV